MSISLGLVAACVAGLVAMSLACGPEEEPATVTVSEESDRDGLDSTDPEPTCDSTMTLYASACRLETGDWSTLDALEDCREGADAFWECLFACADGSSVECEDLGTCAADCPDAPWEDGDGDDDDADLPLDDDTDDDTADDDTETVSCECECVCDIGSSHVDCEDAAACGDCSSECQRLCPALGGTFVSADGDC